MQRNLIVTALVAVLMAGFVLIYTALTPAEAQPSMGAGMTSMPSGGTATSDRLAPLVKGYAEGQEIRFIHTEVSDPKIAQTLTTMMGAKVLLVPPLAQTPATLLANVYVFTNGLKDGGPLGFQPDVFDSPPGTDGYRPLRAINLVTWNDGQPARELKSAAEITAAASRGELAIAQPGIVANVPILIWPGGQR